MSTRLFGVMAFLSVSSERRHSPSPSTVIGAGFVTPPANATCPTYKSKKGSGKITSEPLSSVAMSATSKACVAPTVTATSSNGSTSREKWTPYRLASTVVSGGCPALRAYWWPPADSSDAALLSPSFTNCGGAQFGKPWPRFATPPSNLWSTSLAKSANSLQTVGLVPPPGSRLSAADGGAILVRGGSNVAACLGVRFGVGVLGARAIVACASQRVVQHLMLAA
mmetsp:Transcript_2480/g.7086  ORF Transcript_2480/g.7086 Transcript_2480/m.7086 type:complete len:224 (-) Transcript_2480:58-729(-)